MSFIYYRFFQAIWHANTDRTLGTLALPSRSRFSDLLRSTRSTLKEGT